MTKITRNVSVGHCVVLFAILAAGTTTAVAQEKSDQVSWPRFLGELYTGDAVTSGLHYDWTKEPELAWTLPVGNGYGIGSVADGQYYHFDTDRRGENERLRCIDFATGKTVWTKETPFRYRDLLGYEAGPRSTPTVAGDSVISYGVTGVLIRRKRSNGLPVWSIDTNKKFAVVQNFFGVGSSPLILGDNVIVAVGGSPMEDQQLAPGALDRVSPAGSAVVAFSLSDGKEVWRSGNDLASYSSPRIATLAGKEVILYFARDHLLALDPKDGELLWRQRHRADILESVNAMMPIVNDDKLFISECYRVGSRLLDLSSGKPKTIWEDPECNRPSDAMRRQSMRCHWSTPALIDGYLYGCSGRNNPDSDFRCVEMATGKVMWVEPQRVRSSVCRVGDHLIVWSERGLLQVIRPNIKGMDVVNEWNYSQYRQEETERPSLLSPCWAAPVVLGDRLLIRGDKKVLCLKLSTQP